MCSDIDDKHTRKGRGERISYGAVTDFKEKDGYKPDVKITYTDDKGRMLDQKEAFRYLSHRFHGKGSGKKKTEKRIQKFQEEMVCYNVWTRCCAMTELIGLQNS